MLEADRPLIASQITEIDGSLNPSTVNSTLRTLLKEKYIEIDEIVYSGKVLCRKYRVTQKAREASMSNFVQHYRKLSRRMPMPEIIATLINDEPHDDKAMDQLEQMLKQKRKELENKG
jgi:DNA-binding PadR family transcriptional regulator